MSNWYLDKSVDSVAHQSVKYRNREGYTHRDVLRLAHPKADTEARKALFEWIVRGTGDSPFTPAILPNTIIGFEAARVATTGAQWAELVDEFKLPWEALPDAALNEKIVWESLLPHVGLTALMRNLGRLSNLKVITTSEYKIVTDMFRDSEVVKNSRVHPLNVLTAMVTYRNGHGFRGSNTWTPVGQIIDALDDAFYLSFGNVTGSGKNVRVCLDVSGSMDYGSIAGSPLNPRQASTAMSLVTVRSEDNYSVCAFSQGLTELPFTQRTNLTEAIGITSRLPFQGTDISLPIISATERRQEVDAFVMYTDCEVNAGLHPYRALENYRQKMGRDTKLVVVGLTATNFTIANPADAGMLDVVGFDSSAPGLISEFVAGNIG